MLAKCIVLKPCLSCSFGQLSCWHDFAKQALFIAVLLNQSLTVISFQVLEVIVSVQFADELQVDLLELRINKSHHFNYFFGLLVDQWVSYVIDYIADCGWCDLKMISPESYIVFLRVFIVKIKNLVDLVC
jgi:uncharacterized metal-binding protein